MQTTSDPPLPCEPSSALEWTHLSQISEADRVVVVDMLRGLKESQCQDIVDELAGALRARAIKTQWPGWLRGVVQRARTGAFVPNHALAIQRDRNRLTREAEEAGFDVGSNPYGFSNDDLFSNHDSLRSGFDNDSSSHSSFGSDDWS